MPIDLGNGGLETIDQDLGELSFSVNEASPSFPDVSPLLTLPANFGNLYVGETFRAILSLHSEVPANVAESPNLSVTVSVSVTTPTREQSVSLIHPTHPDSTFVLVPGGNKQYIVEFETADVGVHTISASVTYTPIQLPEDEKVDNSVGEGTTSSAPKHGSGLVAVALAAPITYTKNYRFTTAAGFNVGTKITSVAHDTYLLETRVENATDTTVTIETAEFVAPAGWISRPLEVPNEEVHDAFEDDEEDQVYSTLQDSNVSLYLTNMDSPALMPKEIWQFAYLVQHDPDFFAKNEAAKSSNTNAHAELLSRLPSSFPPPPASPAPRQSASTPPARQSVGTGKFSFSWRREFLGEKGWMMTGHLKRTTNLEYWG